MVQSSMMSAVQFIFRIILGIRKLFEKKEEVVKRKVAPPPPREPAWIISPAGFTQYQGVHTSLKPVFPSPLETQPTQQPPREEGVRAYLIWRDLVSPNYFQDLRRMLESRQRQEEG